MKESIEKYIEYLNGLIAKKRHESEICNKLNFSVQAKFLAEEISLYKEFKDDLQNMLHNNKND